MHIFEYANNGCHMHLQRLHVNKTNIVFWHRSCRPEKLHRPGFLTPGAPISVSRLEWKF